jgi:transglutaminase-like putative cysteine protease
MAAMRKRAAILVIVILFAAASGFALGEALRREASFHDLRVNTIDSYVDLIDGDDPEIRRLASQLRTPEEAYRFVCDEITFVPFAPPGPVAASLKHRMGSCLGKAALLCSLYRAMGIPARDLRIVMGIVITPAGQADHVWIDMEHRGRCLQQDPSGMLGRFDFAAFPGASYADTFVMKETLCFNEKGLAIVSQRNRMRSGPANFTAVD